MSGVIIESLPFEVDPLKAFLCISRGSGSILLEGAGLRQWDLILTDPVRIITGDMVDHKTFHLIERIRRRALHDGGLPFTGGVAGFISYESCVMNASGMRSRHAFFAPGFWFGVYDHCILIDHASGRTYAVVNQDIGSRKDLSAGSILERVMQCRCEGPGEPILEKQMPVTVNYEFSRDGFESAVEEAKGFIRDGDIYQVNIAHRIRVEGLLNPLGLYARLRAINPSPHMGYADLGDLKIVCNSPERLVYLGGGFCETRPIAGTRPRGQTSYEDEFMFRDLTTNEKEIAEHTMMVDMERNDLGRISVPGSVYVDEMMSVEKYSHVMHLVSNIRGKPIRSLSIKEMISAMMPGGTISGVPKSRAMEIIDMLEPVPRGPYTGSLGYISSHVDMNILIRTLIFTGARAYLYVGSGIVYDSIPEKEFDETIYKAGAVLSLLSGSRKPAGSCGVIVRGEWRPPSSKRRFTRRKVLLVDNYDSFTYNLAQYISSAGAKVDVVLRDRIPSDLNRYTHIVISPGPGRPESAGMCIDLLRQEEAIPILGVCLGHQVIALASGGKVEKGPPVHGKVSRIRIVKRSPIFSGLPEVFDAGRYHSLVVNPSSVPGELNVDAISDGGIIMSLSHRRRKVYGIQFHPESVLTPWGMRIIENFLEVRP